MLSQIPAGRLGMRDLLFLTWFAALVPIGIWLPHIGVLLWCWLALMQPHRLTWSFGDGYQLNMIVAVLTIVAWIVSRESKRLPMHATMILMLLFMGWITLTTFFALVPAHAWPKWELTIKALALIVMIMAVMRSRPRVQAVIWMMVLALGYYGVKGGGFVILSGGGYRVMGPEYTMISDNNHLSVALVMMLPVLNYLRLSSEKRLVRIVVLAAMGLTLIAVIGSYSRGGLLALGTMLFFLWWKARNKLAITLLALAMLVPAYYMMPEQWFSRVESIQDYKTDDSFQGRLDAWTFALNVAADRPLVSGGFGATYSQDMFNRYVDGRQARAAHSIYFEVLGEHGFIGLGLFLALIVVGWLNSSWIIRHTRDRPELVWARDLATMLQASMTGYLLGGAAVSLGYYDFFYATLAILAVVRQMVAQAVREPAPAGAGRQAWWRRALPVPAVPRQGMDSRPLGEGRGQRPMPDAEPAG